MRNSWREGRFSIEILVDILIILLIGTGVLFSAVTALGLVRLPDVYTRTHAASKSSTLGVLSILLGTFVHFWFNEGIFNTQMVIAIAFLFITQPVAGHLIGRAAYMTGIKVAEETVRDDMGPAIEKRKNNQQEELENE
ncbi:monovalent cation/H(+) antiporter subunit G [Planococcus sp. 11815]|uniref:Multisubunit sodium/proton antiporter MrpG subunit n=1 Tax=Planococcus citreus TaxID=1373 RepID=A0A497YE31_9BACL|nr:MULTISPECIES: monovalent cation/H(+) antiporter subunit G [Planococcus]MDE0584901.1 monovalent cation/H(+) antiporter subunit G [Planococcus sp. A6]RLJ85362.1 multisubunit sodium/proton antiporter MrpG subunit [Planococcus citreus]